MSVEVNNEVLDLVSAIMKEPVINTRNSKVKRHHSFFLLFSSTPLVTFRKTPWKLALREMEWFLSGSENISDLHESVRHWWTPWADSNGNIKYNYSKQFRNFKGDNGSVDQIANVLEGLKQHPFSRRNVITTWNTTEMQAAPITNCHGSLIQFFARKVNDNIILDMTMYQRSSDVLLGLPCNLIQYWAFLLWLCHQTGYFPGVFSWFGGDCHIYEEHFDFANKLLTSKEIHPEPPKLLYTPSENPEIFKADDFRLETSYDYIFNDKLKMVV